VQALSGQKISKHTNSDIAEWKRADIESSPRSAAAQQGDRNMGPRACLSAFPLIPCYSNLVTRLDLLG